MQAWANVQPHSGAQANTPLYFLACLKPGDKISGT